MSYAGVCGMAAFRAALKDESDAALVYMVDWYERRPKPTKQDYKERDAVRAEHRTRAQRPLLLTAGDSLFE